MNNRVIAIGGSLLGLAVGATAGYLVAKYRLEAKYAQLASDEIEAARTYMKRLYKDGEGFASPGEVLEKRTPTTPSGVSNERHVGPPVAVLERVLDGLKYGTPAPVTKNVFDGTTDDDDEVSEEVDDQPIRIISVKEFMAGEKGYEQVTLTYFAGDATLTDEANDIIDNANEMIGLVNLDRFGHRSRDPRIVYVRNDRISVDFEICKHDGRYAEEVADLQPEPPPNRKRPKR
jgi:hypothetical protein